MNVEMMTVESEAIVAAIEKLCEKYSDEYWMQKDLSGEPPEDYLQDMIDGGWLGIAMPEEYGGAGLGITEAALMMQTVAASGGAFAATSAIHMNIFGLNPVTVFGTEEQKQRILPAVIAGTDRCCFGVTEPNAGLDTTRIQTRAERTADGYVVNGSKIWTSTAKTANKILLLVRTTPRDEVHKPTDGMTLFYTDLDRNHIEVQEIEKMGRKCVDSNAIFIDNLPVPEQDRIGEEGKGFHYILHGLNPERILIAAEAIGVGKQALNRAVTYAKERVVFERPIGMNQGIQHPLAKAWADLQAAELMVFKAAGLYDNGRACGAEANTAKYLSAEAAFKACETAVMTHGGMGYAKEYHVERYMREVMIARLAPVSREMILSFIGEKVLGLPRSY